MQSVSKLLLRSLCGNPIRKSVHENTKTALSLVKVYVNEKTSHKDLKKVDLDFGVKYKLKKLADRKKVTSIQEKIFENFAMEWKRVHWKFCHSMAKLKLRKFENFENLKISPWSGKESIAVFVCKMLLKC